MKKKQTKIHDSLRGLIKSFIYDEKFDLTDRCIGLGFLKKHRKMAEDAGLNEKMVDTLSQSCGFELKWNSKIIDSDVTYGSMRIMKLEEILGEWKNVVYFDFTTADDPIRDFRPVDFFEDEACVGIFTGKNKSDIMYYLDFGEPAESLELDLAGYIEMLIAAKGFRYWQRSLLSIITGKENTESEDFIKYMPQIFPDFKYEEFAALFESLRNKTPTVPQ